MLKSGNVDKRGFTYQKDGIYVQSKILLDCHHDLNIDSYDLIPKKIISLSGALIIR